VTINLTKPMRAWVAEQAEARGFKNEQAYVHQLIKEDKKRQALEQLKQDLKEADDSGTVELTGEMWQKSIERVKARFKTQDRKSRARA
jgi:Arc/MetJ-type ribon-helix-helix transcriptional regulator